MLRKIVLLSCVLVLGIVCNLQAQYKVGQTHSGKCSYYASKFHGRPTASGEKYDKTKYTAAHRKLPFGTILLVTNLVNKKTVEVKVNDRGPFKPERIVDLSEVAAKEIDMIRSGIVKVKIEILSCF